MKVVFDSNIYISALAIPGGVADRALEMGIRGHFHASISQPILEEVLGVLSRKFGRNAEDIARTAICLCTFAEMVGTTRRVSVLADAADNRVLECAQAANADIVVTGDREMLALASWEGIEILSLRQFIERLTGEARQARAPYRVAANESPRLAAPEMAFLAQLLQKRGRRRKA